MKNQVTGSIVFTLERAGSGGDAYVGGMSAPIAREEH